MKQHDINAQFGSGPTQQFEARFVGPAPGRTLIVGSKLYEGREDRRKRYPDAIGVDMLPGDGVDVVANLEEPPPKDLGLFSHVECCSVLEHSRRFWKLAANIQRLMLPGATIYVSVPFVWRVHSYPADFWRFTREGVREIFPRISWVALATAHEALKMNDLVFEFGKEGHPYLARSEILGFGRLLT